MSISRAYWRHCLSVDPEWTTCAVCDGVGKVDGKTCGTCSGTGKEQIR